MKEEKELKSRIQLPLELSRASYVGAAKYAWKRCCSVVLPAVPPVRLAGCSDDGSGWEEGMEDVARAQCGLSNTECERGTACALQQKV